MCFSIYLKWKESVLCPSHRHCTSVTKNKIFIPSFLMNGPVLQPEIHTISVNLTQCVNVSEVFFNFLFVSMPFITKDITPFLKPTLPCMEYKMSSGFYLDISSGLLRLAVYLPHCKAVCPSDMLHWLWRKSRSLPPVLSQPSRWKTWEQSDRFWTSCRSSFHSATRCLRTSLVHVLGIESGWGLDMGLITVFTWKRPQTPGVTGV